MVENDGKWVDLQQSVKNGMSPIVATSTNIAIVHFPGCWRMNQGICTEP